MSVVRKAGFHILRGFRWQESWNLIPLPLGRSQSLKVLQSTICYIMLHCCIFLGNNYESWVCCQWVDMFNRFLPFRCFEYSSGGLPVCQLVFHLGRQVGAVQGRLRCECTPGRALGTLGNFCNCLSKKWAIHGWWRSPHASSNGCKRCQIQMSLMSCSLWKAEMFDRLFGQCRWHCLEAFAISVNVGCFAWFCFRSKGNQGLDGFETWSLSSMWMWEQYIN